MSDGLIALLVVVIIAIVLDGLRRARNSRRNNIKLSKNARRADKLLSEAQDAPASLEFPSGGARPRKAVQSEHMKGNSRDDFTAGSHVAVEELLEVKSSIPQQVGLELDDPVPMLMDSVGANDTHEDAESILNKEPALGDFESLDNIEEAPIEESQSSADLKKQPFDKEPESRSVFSRKKRQDSQRKDENKKSDLHEILVVNVMARSGTEFVGAVLFEALMELKLKFGQMDVFHRHLNNDGDAPIIFSIANIVEPGRFDFVNMDESQTPGVCLFLSLPTACEGAGAYEDFIATAKGLAERLGGELKDENRSALTNQTIEHGRQRVMEFERRIQLQKNRID